MSNLWLSLLKALKASSNEMLGSLSGFTALLIVMDTVELGCIFNQLVKAFRLFKTDYRQPLAILNHQLIKIIW
jgi:hypothetical protein